MIKVGLIVNPVAGMGGSVGLKGTDGTMYEKALSLGAKQVTSIRIKDVLSLITRKDIKFLVAKGIMGENYIKDFSYDYKVIGEISSKTESADTKKIAKEMILKEIKLLIFVGGDGTARDILDVVGLNVPVIAIPSGVKMFSSVFALSAHAAAEMINKFSDKFIKKEVLDIDEDEFRNNRLAAKHYGFVMVPDIKELLQNKKAPSNKNTIAEDTKKGLAEYIVDKMQDDVMYILGPGTTLDSIAYELCMKKTLLGVDAVYDGELIGSDLNEEKILELIKKYKKAKIIITPIGGNGFIFGRGSKQISPKVLKLIKKENVIIVGTMDKLENLNCLRVDTGDYEVDKELMGMIGVVVGADEEFLMEVK